MIGIDITNIARIEQKIQSPAFIKKVFTNSEIEYYNKTGKRTETLAGFFASKEAIAKAINSGFNFEPTDIEILHKDNGAPYPVLHARAKEVLNQRFDDKNPTLHLSISHDSGVAVAVCYILFN